MKLAISPFCDQVDQIDLYLVENLIQTLYIFVKIHLRLSVIFQSTPSWREILDENWSTELHHTSFFQIFHVELEYVIFEMIHWANLKGRQF